MTETVTSRDSTRVPLGHNHLRRRAVLPVRRFDRAKFEISVGKDPSGKDVVTATRVGN